MAIPAPLPPERLYRQCDPGKFDFQDTSRIDGPTEVVGQARAIEAIRFGIGIRHDGFNLFALGPNGTGKHTAISQYLHQKAPNAPKPEDWCYVYNFDQPHQPRALQLEAGRAAILRSDMTRLVEDLFTVIPSAFSSDEYQAQNKAIKEELLEKQSEALETLKQKAEKRNIALMRTPSGFALAPMKEGEVIKPSEFMKLPPEERESIEKEIGTLQEDLQTIMEQVPEWQRETQNKIKALNREIAGFAVKPLLAELRKKYAASKSILTYFDAVENDIIENFDRFIEKEESPFAQAIGLASSESGRKKPHITRYQVNVIIDNCETCGAPVIYEDKPAYSNLIGRIEHLSQMGTLLTDFTLIKPGALHRANGGYLILDALRLLSEPYAYEGLKQAIRSKQIRIESLGQAYSLISTVSLEPEPIPLKLKVILLGERALYYLLCEHDPDFSELFKVAADFEDDINRDEESHLAYARLISDVARKDKLRHFDKAAVARIIEHCSRLSDNATKLSTHMQSISDLVRESDYRAEENGHALVSAEDVQQALDAKLRRAGRIQERIQEAILRQTILIDTDGEKAGQINGLAVYSIGNHSFGRPSRITARVRMGDGSVADIEREVEMGGPIHSKGMMILSGFLGARYAADRPLSLSATLVFEQSYSGVEGDSASSAELYALLSALADAPIRQSFAVTGSVNQYGEVQAIGGVNEKIEGFFELCEARGLTGKQGVLIPKANVENLMLRQNVVEAVRKNLFHIYPVTHVDEGIEILTGRPAGEPDDKGDYPAETINGRIVSRLQAWSEKQREFSAPPKESTSEKKEINPEITNIDDEREKDT